MALAAADLSKLAATIVATARRMRGAPTARETEWYPTLPLPCSDMTTLGDDATGQDEFKQGASSESKVHVRVQQRNGRKCITTVQVRAKPPRCWRCLLT